MSGHRQTVVVTGATSGIGRATALTLAGPDTKLILLARREKIGRALADEICQRHGGDSAIFVAADLSEPEQVRAAAKIICAAATSIDTLINNAGARYDRYQCTSSGRELTFACNHLGHFLLTCLLLEKLAAAPAARVITVSSGNHGTVPADGQWEISSANYDRRAAYSRSKMANIVFASELGRRLQITKISSCAYEPGGVFSAFSKNNGLVPWSRHVISHLLKGDLVTPTKAACDIERLCREPAPEKFSGRYVRRESDLATLQSFHTPAEASHLWNLSLSLTGLVESEAPSVWSVVKPDNEPNRTPPLQKTHSPAE